MKIDIDINLNIRQHPGTEVPDWARDVLTKLGLIIQNQATGLANQETIMATLEQVAQDMTDETTAIDSVAALITGLQQQVADALSGVTLPPAVQAKVDAIFVTAEANKAKLAAALAANVPPVPVTP